MKRNQSLTKKKFKSVILNLFERSKKSVRQIDLKKMNKTGDVEYESKLILILHLK